MPKGPQGLKRPADVIGNAIHVMRIATRQDLGEPQRPRGSPCEQPLVKRLASPGIFNTFQKSGNCKKGGTGQMGRRELAVHDKRAIKISVKSVTNVVAFFRSCGDQRKRISKQP